MIEDLPITVLCEKMKSTLGLHRSKPFIANPATLLANISKIIKIKAFLKKTNVTLEYIRDDEMLMMLFDNLRGGLIFQAHHRIL